MNIAQIEADLKQLIENIAEHSFIFDLLLAYTHLKHLFHEKYFEGIGS